MRPNGPLTLLVAALLAGCFDAPTYAPDERDLEVDARSDADMHVVVDMRGEDLPDTDVLAMDPQPDGAPCVTDADCVGGTCRTGEAFPGGFCTNEGCVGGCATGSQCSDRDWGAFCAPTCDADSECRDGYACGWEGRNDTRRRMCTPIRGLADGEPCSVRSDCQGRSCMDWVGGYCSTFRCETADDCSNLGVANNVCLQDGSGFSLCVRACQSSADCRDGYLCQDVGFGAPERVCLEDPAKQFDPSIFEPGPLDIRCGTSPDANGEASLTYEIDPDTTSYMVTPLTRDGQPLDPWWIALPDGTIKNFVLERLFLTTPASILASMNPTLVPAGPAFVDMLAAGTNQYKLETPSDDVCYYVLQKDTPGTRLDLNIYLVAVPGVDASTAAQDPNFSAVFDEVRRIYGQVGIELGTLRFLDVDADAALRFGVLRSEAEVGELVKLSEPAGTDLGSLLSVNVFFVGEFAMRSVIGISSGLPGPAGLHGTHGSGVVFTAEYMGGPVEDALGVSTDGNVYTALLLAHEVGHWLGLFHTTETSGFAHDQLEDTPECDNPAFAQNCPDFGNLMFPYAAVANTQMTDDQGFVIAANPSTRDGESMP